MKRLLASLALVIFGLAGCSSFTVPKAHNEDRETSGNSAAATHDRQACLDEAKVMESFNELSKDGPHSELLSDNAGMLKDALDIIRSETSDVELYGLIVDMHNDIVYAFNPHEHVAPDRQGELMRHFVETHEAVRAHCQRYQ